MCNYALGEGRAPSAKLGKSQNRYQLFKPESGSKMSETQQIYSRISAVMQDVSAIGKDNTNAKQGFKFRGIDDVYNELHSILAKHKVFTLPNIISERTEERTTNSGGNLIYRVLHIQYTFFTDDGSNVIATVIGEGMDSGDKASNKAMSVAHKYCLLQAFCIPTNEEKDPDAATPPPSTKKPATPVTPPQPVRISKAQIDALKAEIALRQIDVEKYFKHRHISDLADLFIDEYEVAMSQIKSKPLKGAV